MITVEHEWTSKVRETSPESSGFRVRNESTRRKWSPPAFIGMSVLLVLDLSSFHVGNFKFLVKWSTIPRWSMGSAHIFTLVLSIFNDSPTFQRLLFVASVRSSENVFLWKRAPQKHGSISTFHIPHSGFRPISWSRAALFHCFGKCLPSGFHLTVQKTLFHVVSASRPMSTCHNPPLFRFYDKHSPCFKIQH